MASSSFANIPTEAFGEYLPLPGSPLPFQHRRSILNVKLLRQHFACILLPVLLIEAVSGAAPNREAIQAIGSIDLYGLRTVSAVQVRQALGLKEGDPAPVDTDRRRQIEGRISLLPNVVQARIAGVCCDEGKAAVFVGIEERGSPKIAFRPVPSKQILLPLDIVELHQRFETALTEAVQKGDSADDLSQGHSLMANSACRELQQQFVISAASHLKTLRNVAKDSSNPEHRAIAVWILGYAPDKRAVVDDLVYALEDGDAGVRNNATRALAAIGSLAERKPELKIRIPITRFVAMLNSIEWTDRNKGLFALQSLATRANPDALKNLRNRALSSLIEMARWQSKSHAFPAFVLVGRIAQMEEKDILSRWPTERETVILKALDTKF